MADFLVRDIDERVAERLKEIARQKGWPLNDVILHLLKQALGLAEPDPPPVPGDIASRTRTVSQSGVSVSTSLLRKTITSPLPKAAARLQIAA